MALAGDGATTGELLLAAAAAVPVEHYLLVSAFLLLLFLYRFLEMHFVEDLLSGFRGQKVSLTFDPASQIYHGVVAKCRSLHGRYQPTLWLTSPHLQTTFINFFGRPPSFTYKRQLYTTRDGGTVALDWLPSLGDGSCSTDEFVSKDDATPILVFVPGLTSDQSSAYVKHMVYAMAKCGWHVVVSNHRGLGGVSITSDCLYNAGWTEDIREVINYLHQHYSKAPLFAVGTSLGANMLVKYLGEEEEGTPVAGAASVCSPWDLVVCDRFICRKLVQRLYDKALAIGLKGYAQLHQPVLSRLANWEGITKSRSVRDFDNHATCLVAKYETVDTYYRQCSSVPYVGNVAVPMLCISALDDPVCTREAIPWDECRANKNIVLATTVHGGHLGFFQGLTARKLWWVGAVREFLSALHDSPYMHGQKKALHQGSNLSFKSTIDKSPYLNVMGDGMVAVVTNDADTSEYTTGEASCQVKPEEEMKDDKINHNDSAGVGQTSNAPESKTTADQNHPAAVQETARDVATPVKRSLNKLVRYQGRSVWLLACIALFTSWPLLGSLAYMAFKKRFKNSLSRLKSR